MSQGPTTGLTTAATADAATGSKADNRKIAATAVFGNTANASVAVTVDTGSPAVADLAAVVVAAAAADANNSLLSRRLRATRPFLVICRIRRASRISPLSI